MKPQNSSRAKAPRSRSFDVQEENTLMPFLLQVLHDQNCRKIILGPQTRAGKQSHHHAIRLASQTRGHGFRRDEQKRGTFSPSHAQPPV